ncbi:MAG: exodeoxyribonuclease VII small subunit [Pseudomonadota bacterium]
MTKDAKDNKGDTIEAQLEQLQALVTRMESGELSLEDTLDAFEQGVKLTRLAQAHLAEAEQKVQLLTERDGEPVEAPFDTPES